jgi:ABC-2 type transport system permease protein
MVTGRFSNTNTTGISDIPVIVVNLDEGQLGDELVNIFQSKELAELMAPSVMTDPALARQAIDKDEAAAAVIIPAGFSQSVMGTDQSVVQIELYANPTRPTSTNVIKTVVETFTNQVEIGRVNGTVTITQLLQSGRIQPQQAAALGADLAQRQTEAGLSSSIQLKSVTSEGEAVKFDVLALLAPGMALMFLMYTVANGGRSLLAERGQGTLPRLLISPTSTAQVLGGKIFGIYLTGVAQMLILIMASTLLFQLQWGDPLAVLVLVLAAVFGAVGWGMLVTSLARTPGQVGAVGSAIMLLFGILGGSFIDVEQMPTWFQWVSKITPNAWGLNGFNQLAMGGGLPEIGGMVLALLVMGIVLFGVSALFFNRRGMAQA